MDRVESPNQHKDVLRKIWNESKRPCVFNTNELCMTAGCFSNEERQLSETVMEMKEHKDMLSKSIKEKHKKRLCYEGR